MTADDASHIDRIKALKEKVLPRVLAWPDGFHEVDDPEIIQAAWGPRRVSSRNRGMEIGAYPRSVGAMRSVWVDWILHQKDYVTIVIAKKPAAQRVQDAIAGLDSDEGSMPSICADEVRALLDQREEYRAARRFAEADEIRDRLVAAGVQVADGRIAS